MKSRLTESAGAKPEGQPAQPVPPSPERSEWGRSRKLAQRATQTGMREGRDASGRHVVNVRVIAPNEIIPAAWILNYDPQDTDCRIRLGYEDARKTLG